MTEENTDTFVVMEDDTTNNYLARGGYVYYVGPDRFSESYIDGFVFVNRISAEDCANILKRKYNKKAVLVRRKEIIKKYVSLDKAEFQEYIRDLIYKEKKKDKRPIRKLKIKKR